MDELNNILFDACRNGKVEVIKYIVENNSNLMIKKDAQDNTALHIACENGLLLDGIKYLYSAYPEALTIFNDEGASPFHMACFHGKSVENLKFLHSKLPIGLVATNENGDLPMHWINENTSEELVKYLLVQFPKSAEVKNNEDALPIHVACNKGLSLNIIRMLHRANPKGILQPDTDGILPIHDACEGIDNLDVIKYLYEVCPESFKKADKKGNYALHYAVCSNPEVVQFVIEANKLALQTPNNYGYLPIHKACSLSVEINIIKVLHETYPKGIKAKTFKGLLPFHLAITDLPILIYLHGLFGEAVKTPDKSGRYPIHIACEKDASIDVIVFLTEKNPLAVRIADHAKMLPLHHAIVNNSPCSTIKYLVKTYPEALNDMEVLQFLRANYYEYFQDLMVHPGKLGYQSASFSSPQKSHKRALFSPHNVKQSDDALHPDLEKNNEAYDAAEMPVKLETSLFEDDKSLHVSLEAGNRMSQQTIEFDDSADNDSCASIESVEEVQLMETEGDSSLRKDISIPQEKQETLNKESYMESFPKRRRIGTLRASTIATAFAALGESTNNNKINQELSESEEGQIPSYKKWTEDEIKALASALCNVITTSEANNKCNIYNDLSHTLKTKNPRQCYDFLRRTKSKIESDKKYTSDEYIIYGVLKSYNNNNLPPFKTGNTTKLSQNQDSPLLSSPMPTTTTELTTSTKKGAWTENEKEIFASALRDYTRTKKKECLFNYIPKKIKTRNFRQCYDLAYRIKSKVESSKKCTTSDEDIIIYNLLMSCDKSIFSSYNEKSKASRNDSIHDTTTLSQSHHVSSQSQDSSLPSSPVPATTTTELTTSNKKGHWTENEKEIFASALRDYSRTNKNECIFNYIPQKIKTRNFRQCYDFAYRVKSKVESSKKRNTSDEDIIYNLLVSCDKNIFSSEKNNSSRTDSANIATASQSRHKSSPASSSLPAQTTTATTTYNTMNKKGVWKKYEIDAFISVLDNVDMTIQKSVLFERISKKIKSRNQKQCSDFVRSSRKKVSIKTATPKDYIIYNFFQKYNSEHVNNDDSCDLSSSKDVASDVTAVPASSPSQHSPLQLSALETNDDDKIMIASNKKGHWDEYEIDAFVSVLDNVDMTIEKNDLFERISKKVKSRNQKQCSDFVRSNRKKVSRKTATSKDYIIYNFFKKYDSECFDEDDLCGLSSSKDGASDITAARASLPSQHSSLQSSAVEANNNDKIISILTTSLTCADDDSDEDDDQFLV